MRRDGLDRIVSAESVELSGRQLDDVGLESGARAWPTRSVVASFAEQCRDLVVERDQDRQHAVLDQREIARDRLEREEQVALPFLQAGEDLLLVEPVLDPGALAPVDVSEEVLDRIERERIVVAAEDAGGQRRRGGSARRGAAVRPGRNTKTSPRSAVLRGCSGRRPGRSKSSRPRRGRRPGSRHRRPASTRDVLTTMQRCLALSAPRIVSSRALRCFGHISAERW